MEMMVRNWNRFQDIALNWYGKKPAWNFLYHRPVFSHIIKTVVPPEERGPKKMRSKAYFLGKGTQNG
ncbi:hypothetical protein COY07_06210 [Candidatus Peregrinibacteria bacterium CG_4_10_14_0_2_um_filter_43_11]|nr:MAG: hypothetical protein COY07_06210 [Candidatus Peregrinibacteria bacterium CG_4_10_14_0_2_um_filter_43_11]